MLPSAFYYTYDLLNMFQAPLCPSSGAHDYIPLFTTWNVCFLGFDAGKMWVGCLCDWAGGTAVANPQLTSVKTQEAKFHVVNSGI
jgi:hypothetical protein